MQFMFLPRPTKETRTRKMLRLPLHLLLLQHCRPQQVQLRRLQIQLLPLPLPLHSKGFSHHYLKMSSGRCSNGCWRRSGRSNHVIPLRKTRSMRTKLFSRSSFVQSLSLVCDGCMRCPADLEFFSAPVQSSEDVL